MAWDTEGNELIPEPANDTNPLSSQLNYTIDGNKMLVDFNQRLNADEGLNGPCYDWDKNWKYSSECSIASNWKIYFIFARN